MAGAAVATEKKPASGSAKGAAPEKKPKISETDELAALAQANKELEDEERAKTGSQNNFMNLVTNRSGVLDKNNPAYMKDAKLYDYVIASKKLKVSDKKQCVDATILGMFKVYAEKKAAEKEDDLARTVSFWPPDQAVQCPFVEGNNFERQLPNGNILVPVHWVFLYLHDFPELEDVLLPFQGKGNSIYAQLEKLVKAESSVCSELRFSISNQGIYHEKRKQTYYYPKFEITGHNYKLTEEGKVIKTKDGDVDKDVLKEIFTRSNKLYGDYREYRMVAKKNVQALLGSPGRAALPAGKGGYENDDGDSENVNF
jgi:hypothetical protein